MKALAVFDTGPGIVGLYEVKRDYLNYYVDDKFEYYGLYKRDAVNARIEFDFDAINFFKYNDKAEFGERALKKHLKYKKILCLGTKLTSSEKTLENFTDSDVLYIDVPLLINACNDGIADEILKMISEEYFSSLDLSSFDLIFLASSGLHLKKDFFIKYFDLEKTGTEIFSNTDAILEDYNYKKEEIIFMLLNQRANFIPGRKSI